MVKIVGFYWLVNIQRFRAFFTIRISVKFSSLVIHFSHVKTNAVLSVCVVNLTVLLFSSSDLLLVTNNRVSFVKKSFEFIVCWMFCMWVRVLLAMMITEKIINFFKARKRYKREWEKKETQKKNNIFVDN